VGAHVVPGRERNEEPVSSNEDDRRIFPRASSSDPRPLLFEPGPDHSLVSLLGANGRDLRAPTRGPEPNGQGIGMVRDTESAQDRVTNPSQGPAIGLESGLEGALAEDPQDAAPSRVGQPGDVVPTRVGCERRSARRRDGRAVAWPIAERP
jgi:hypothetical protein